MLGLMGTMGEIAAAHLLPRVGGVRFDGVSPGSPDALDLLTTLVGPPPG